MAQAVTQVTYTIKQYQVMLTNTMSLGNFNWSNATGEIAQIQTLLNMGSLQASQVAPIISRLQSVAAENGIAINLPLNYQSQFQQWQMSLGNSSLAMQQQLAIAPQQQMTGAQNLSMAQMDSANAEGAKQAIQANSEITAQGVDTMMQMHATLIAMANSLQTQMATQNERLAVGDQATANFLAPRWAAVTSQGYGPNGP